MTLKDELYQGMKFLNGSTMKLSYESDNQVQSIDINQLI